MHVNGKSGKRGLLHKAEQKPPKADSSIWRINQAPDIIDRVIRINKTVEFSDWFKELSNGERQLIDARLYRIEQHEHFGDVRSLGKGLAELRWRNGIRIYFYKQKKIV